MSVTHLEPEVAFVLLALTVGATEHGHLKCVSPCRCMGLMMRSRGHVSGWMLGAVSGAAVRACVATACAVVSVSGRRWGCFAYALSFAAATVAAIAAPSSSPH